MLITNVANVSNCLGWHCVCINGTESCAYCTRCWGQGEGRGRGEHEVAVKNYCFNDWVALRRAFVWWQTVGVYLLLVYLVTALVPSLTACLASSPGRRRRTAGWISREGMVDLLL